MFRQDGARSLLGLLWHAESGVQRVAAGAYDLAKVSYYAALRLANEVVALPVGAALGWGVGPLLLAGPGAGARACAPHERVLCPGEWTTAHLLYRLFHPGEGRVEQVVFSEIMPALERGEAARGVCIHEGRFTWEQRGLERVEDLGERWEAASGCALPLGGLVARRSLDAEVVRRACLVLRDSVEWGRAHREDCLPSMRAHAQELSDEVLWAHVDLYVDERTVELGDTGRRALAQLARLAREAGLLADGADLEVAST